MSNYFYVDPVVDHLELEDWLEDNYRFSRYSVKNQKDQSVWICTECDHLAENCTCGDELAVDLDLA